jgi:hypothetical protein
MSRERMKRSRLGSGKDINLLRQFYDGQDIKETRKSEGKWFEVEEKA